MGSTTLLVRRTRLGEWLGVPSHHTMSAHISTALTAFIQEALREVYAFHPWEFLRYTGRVRLYAGQNAGTVTLTAGSTAVTGTGTGWTVISGNLRMRVGEEIYPVTSIDSATGLTLATAALVARSAYAYYLYIDTVNLGSTLKTLLAAFVGAGNTRLTPVTPAEMAEMRASGFMAGHPQYWAPRGRDSSGYTEIELWPVPWYNEFLHVEGMKAGTIPTADGEYDDVPDEFSRVVDLIARRIMFAWRKDERYSIVAREAAEALIALVDQHRASRGPDMISLDPQQFGLPPHDLSEGLY